jgi:hypothetical protein
MGYALELENQYGVAEGARWYLKSEKAQVKCSRVHAFF